MLGLLDRATKLTSPQGENRGYLDPRLKPQACDCLQLCKGPLCAKKRPQIEGLILIYLNGLLQSALRRG